VVNSLATFVGTRLDTVQTLFVMLLSVKRNFS